jgi:hypothetical protein
MTADEPPFDSDETFGARLMRESIEDNEARRAEERMEPPSISDPHYVVRVTNMPPTELECRCGIRMEGADCLARMRVHVREGNARDR